MESHDFKENTRDQLNSLMPFNSVIISFFLTISLFLLIFLKFYGNGGGGKQRGKKYDDLNMENLPGPEVLPGPTSWDPTGLLGILVQFLPIENAINTGLKWCSSYGDIFQFSALNQTFVVMNSGPSAQSLFKSSDMGHLMKPSEIVAPLKPYIVNGVLVSTGKFWQHERKLLLKSQSYGSLKAYMPMLNRHCKTFVSGLEHLFKDGEPHEINGLISSTFIKIISEMITGFNSEQSEECDQYHHNFQIWKESVVYRIIHPWCLFPPLWKLHPMSKKNDKAVEAMFEFARKRIREHGEKRSELESEAGLTEPNVTQDAIVPPKTEFRSVLDDLVDGGVEERQIIDEINTMLFGGHETGATTMHFFFFLMALNPNIQKECQQEVDELLAENFNGDNAEEENLTFTYEAVSSKLKLVERCILETLRLFAPVFIVFRKLHSPLKTDYNGQDIVIPAGTNVVVPPLAIHRNPKYFPEPEKFDPYRFLPEECAKRHPCAFIPFSAGPRNCLGLKFSMIEMKTIAAYILRNFSITTTDRLEDIPLLPYITLTPSKDFTFRFMKRDI